MTNPSRPALASSGDDAPAAVAASPLTAAGAANSTCRSDGFSRFSPDDSPTGLCSTPGKKDCTSNFISPGVRKALCPCGESEPSVTLACAPGESSSCGDVKESSASIPEYNGVKSPALLTAHGLSGKSCPLSRIETGPQDSISIDPGPCVGVLMSSNVTTLRVAHSSAIQEPQSSSSFSMPGSEQGIIVNAYNTIVRNG